MFYGNCFDDFWKMVLGMIIISICCALAIYVIEERKLLPNDNITVVSSISESQITSTDLVQVETKVLD